MTNQRTFKRPNGEGFLSYDVTVLEGWPISSDRDVSEMVVKSDTAPERYDIIADVGDKFAVVWTNAVKRGEVYFVDYALWPSEWRKYFPAD